MKGGPTASSGTGSGSRGERRTGSSVTRIVTVARSGWLSILADVDDGRLKRVLVDWCAPFPSCHLYDPHWRQPAADIALLVEALRPPQGRRSLLGRMRSS